MGSEGDWARDASYMFRVLSHPKRLLLMKEFYRGSKPSSELMKKVPVKTSSELAFHLGRFRGLVKKVTDLIY